MLPRAVYKHVIYRAATELRGQRVFSHLAKLERTQWIDRNAIRAIQLTKLRRLLDIARQNSPAYTDRLPRTFAPETLNDLASIPTLTKAELRELHVRLASTRHYLFSTSKTTGGSTGEPVTLKKSADAVAQELAATWRGYRWANLDIGDRQARFWGVPISTPARLRAKLIDAVCNRLRLSAFAFTDASFPAYVRELNRFRADYFYGYASMLGELCQWLDKSGTTLAQAPRAVITTSEILTPQHRAAISRALKCRIYNEYGSGELGTIAHECPNGQLHISDENMIVEILDGDRLCAPGEKGELVVTELNNFAFPLIRYRTGDFGSLSADKCACGRALTILSSVFGRAYDYVTGCDGKRYHAEFLIYAFEEAQRLGAGISQFQVRQTAADKLEILIVEAPRGFPPSEEAALVARIKQLLGTEMHILLKRVSGIPRERSGKMRVIVGLTSAE